MQYFGQEVNNLYVTLSGVEMCKIRLPCVATATMYPQIYICKMQEKKK
jgi:hypothetical protein